MRPDAGDNLILPGRWSARFAAWSFRYVRRLFARRFHGVHLERASLELAAKLYEGHEPLLIVMNHSSWWDPLIFVFLHGAFVRTRRVIAPMDRSQLERFSIFRRVGVFGIDPDDPRSLAAMIRYVEGELAVDRRSVIFITPQGKFVDARSPIENRPGAATLASRVAEMRVVAVAVEYGFWIDARPEIFLRMREVSPPAERSTAHWHSSITQAMQENSVQLAASVISRDEGRFARIAGAGSAKINPIYDLWLRLTGRGIAIDMANRAAAREPRSS